MERFEVLKKWRTRAGYKAVVIQTCMGHNCGYVGISNEHCILTEDIDNLEVHGGVTYASNSKDYPIKSNLYWIGFDCAHYNDTATTCDLNYCMKECESLSLQLKEKGFAPK